MWIMNGIVLYMVRLTKSVKERKRSLIKPAISKAAPGIKCLTRRRGDELLAAIFSATIGQLAEVGYSALSFEAVAHNAHTGKASLYRRWPSKVDLVVDALVHEMNKCEIPLDLSDLRAGLISKLNSVSEAFSGELGKAVAGCFSAFQREPKLQSVAEEKLINPRKIQMMNSLKNAAAAGHIKVGALSPLVSDLPMAFVLQAITFEGRPPSSAEIIEFVDSVMLPLLQN